MRVCSFCGETNEDWMDICQRCGNSVVNAAVKKDDENKVNTYTSRNRNVGQVEVNIETKKEVNKETKKEKKQNKFVIENEEKKPIENLDLKIILIILLLIFIALLIYTISTCI